MLPTTNTKIEICFDFIAKLIFLKFHKLNISVTDFPFYFSLFPMHACIVPTPLPYPSLIATKKKMKYGLLVLGSWILGNLYDRTGVEVIRTPSVDTPCWQASMRRIGWLYRFLSRKSNWGRTNV